jgi:hypothetical protein
MENIVGMLPQYIEILCQLIGAVAVLATVVVRLTPSPKDDDFLHGFMAKFLKVISYLPTIGINPRTKKLEEAYKEMKGE